MLTSREAQTILPGDLLPSVQDAQDVHSGQVLTAPERTNSTYNEVRFLLRCTTHADDEEEVRVPAHKLIAVERFIA
jgi:hypothetical protein